jgi:hypothetical protein
MSDRAAVRWHDPSLKGGRLDHRNFPRLRIRLSAPENGATPYSTCAFVTMVGQILREPAMESRRRFLRTAAGAGIAGICRGEEAFSIPVIRTKTKLATVPVFVCDGCELGRGKTGEGGSDQPGLMRRNTIVRG